MAKNKKWNKVVARIQALEDALAGLLSGMTGTKRRKTKKAPAKKKSKSKAPARKPAKTRKLTKTSKPTKKSAASSTPARQTKPRKKKKNLRVAVAENAPILPQPPIPSL